MIFADLFSLEVGCHFRFSPFGEWLQVIKRGEGSVLVAFCINPHCMREVTVNRYVYLI